jgi:Iron-containing redox enzyme
MQNDMQSNLIMFPRINSDGEYTHNKILASNEYNFAEQRFIELLALENLDGRLYLEPELASEFENILATAIVTAYEGNNLEKNNLSDKQSLIPKVYRNLDNQAAHLFLQRILYRINRLYLFWYDDLHNYDNERSIYLQQIRDRIETAWQKWELAQTNVETLHDEALRNLDVKQALINRVQDDLNPKISAGSRYIREEMNKAGYRHLLAIGSFDGLVEGSRLSRILGGAANPIQCTLIKVLLEEYGNGRFNRKHSTFFAQMLNEFGMNMEPEAYFDLVPWEVLACTNHNFLMTERKRHYLRYCGGLTYFEVAGPSAYHNYLNAAQRLDLSDAAMAYWDLHIREDERHGQWMLDDVALPLAEMYSNNAWELVLGYDQEKFMANRASESIVKSIHKS